MSRLRFAKLSLLPAALVVALVTAACGTERISVHKQASQPAGGALYHGAVLFSERCAGCHTLAAAATHGSPANIRDAQGNSGPNLNQRCEKPIDRVLYAIENGGFSGAYMPQNIVVGQDAVDVAEFVSKYAGTQAQSNPGQQTCAQESQGSLPASTAGLNSTDSGATATTALTSAKPATSAANVAARGTRTKKHPA